MIHNPANILKNNVAHNARVPTVSDRTFDSHPKREEVSITIPNEGTKSKY